MSPALQAASLPLSHWVQGVPICLGKVWQPHAIVLCSFRSPTYWTDQGSRAVFVAHSWIRLFEFSSCHWPVVVFQKQSTVKFKVIGRGSWWSKVNISIVFSDIEAEFEGRETGRPSDSDGLNQLLTSSASLPTRVLWVWDLGKPYSIRLFSLAVGLTWMEGDMGVTTGHWAFVHVKVKDTKLEQLLRKLVFPTSPHSSPTTMLNDSWCARFSKDFKEIYFLVAVRPDILWGKEKCVKCLHFKYDETRKAHKMYLTWSPTGMNFAMLTEVYNRYSSLTDTVPGISHILWYILSS